MREFVVYREGHNEANQNPAQGLPRRMPVLRILAGSPEEACEMAARQVSVAENQRLFAEPADLADAKEATLNVSPRTGGDASTIAP